MCCFLMFNSSLQKKMNEDHQQAIEEEDNQVQAIKCENVALQAQRDVYQAQLVKCQDTIIHLRTPYVDHARDLGKYNTIIIVRKHTRPANDKYHDLPYYIARIQRHKRYVKLRWFDRHFPDHEIIVEIQIVFMRLTGLKRKGMQSADTTILG